MDNQALILRLKKLQNTEKVLNDPVLRDITDLMLSISDPNFTTTQKIKLQVMKLEREKMDKEIQRLSAELDNENSQYANIPLDDTKTDSKELKEDSIAATDVQVNEESSSKSELKDNMVEQVVEQMVEQVKDSSLISEFSSVERVGYSLSSDAMYSDVKDLLKILKNMKKEEEKKKQEEKKATQNLEKVKKNAKKKQAHSKKTKITNHTDVMVNDILVPTDIGGALHHPIEDTKQEIKDEVVPKDDVIPKKRNLFRNPFSKKKKEHKKTQLTEKTDELSTSVVSETDASVSSTTPATTSETDASVSSAPPATDSSVSSAPPATTSETDSSVSSTTPASETDVSVSSAPLATETDASVSSAPLATTSETGVSVSSASTATTLETDASVSSDPPATTTDTETLYENMTSKSRVEFSERKYITGDNVDVLEILKRLQAIVEKNQSSAKIRVLKRPTIQDRGVARTTDGIKDRLNKSKLKEIKKDSKNPAKVSEVVEKMKGSTISYNSIPDAEEDVKINLYV